MIEPYTSVAAFKKELATNPAGPLSMLLPAAGAALKVPAALGASGKVSSGLAKLGRGVEASTAFVDPARGLYEGAGAIKKYGPRVAAAIPEMTTGTPDAVFELAFKSAADRGLDAKAIREGFNKYYQGSGDAVGLSQDVESAIKQIELKASQDWVQNRGQITGAANAPIDWSSLRTALNDAYQYYGGPSGANTVAAPDARAALDTTTNLFREYANDPSKNNLAGLDAIKRDLKSRADDMTRPKAEREAFLKMHGSVRGLLGKISPEYADLMDEYSTLLDTFKTMESTAGAGAKVNANAQMSRLMKAFQTPGGVQVIQKLSEADPTIPYKIAGAALHNNPTGMRQVIFGGGGAGTAAVAALNDPVQLATIIPALIGGLAVSSPKVMGKVAYGAGRGAAALGAVGDIPLAPGLNVGNVVSGASKLAYPGALASEQLQFARNKVEENAPPSIEFPDGTSVPILEPEEDEASARQPLVVNVYPPGDPRNNATPEAYGGRVGRKSGGRVANAISTEVDRTRALLGNKTASMLSMPDDAIVTALNHAKNT
jgi:hypothetical protein